jgi:hypothetical protein
MLEIKIKEITGTSTLYISREVKDGAVWFTLITPNEDGSRSQKDFDHFEDQELHELINFLIEAKNKKLDTIKC